jgi:hypothetical protein
MQYCLNPLAARAPTASLPIRGAIGGFALRRQVKHFTAELPHQSARQKQLGPSGVETPQYMG